MGIIDTIKTKLQKDAPVLSICMLGPRAVGKTTVAASIFSESVDGINGTQLFMRSGNSLTSKLITYREELSQAIKQRDVAQLPATEHVADFLFELGILGKNPTVKIAIKDFPGEDLIDKPQDVEAFMAESQVVLVAIDTPYLMVDDGAYNEEHNKPQLVKDYLQKHSSQLSNKLVLFVPLKCERWFHDGQIDSVSGQVVKMYGDLKKLFLQNNTASVITPILTLGGMEFDKMTDNITKQGKQCKLATYRLYENDPTYTPLFCSQPIYYLLSYVSGYYDWSQKQPKSIFERLKDTINSYLTSDDEFRLEISKMSKLLLTDEHGYRVVTSNSIFSI